MEKMNFQEASILEMLTLEQMKNVLGGRAETCTIKPSNGEPYSAPDPYANGSAGNTACLAWISIYGGSCSYDCTYDGVG